MKFESDELKKFSKIRDLVDKSQRPLFFFHDDPDGLCSFLAFRKYYGKGFGLPVKSKPIVNDRFYSRVEEYKPDCIITLDLAIVEQDFINFVKEREIKLVIIDHHALRDVQGYDVYYNPKQFRKNDSTANASLCYYILEEKDDLLWIATVGTVADWQKPKFYMKIKKELPELLEYYDVENKSFHAVKTNYSKTSPEYLLYETNIGYIVRIVSFALKGNTTIMKKSIAALMRVKHPSELINQSTGTAKFLTKRYDSYFNQYCSILQRALSQIKEKKPKIIVFTYDDKDSFTGELSNHLYYFYKDAFIMVGRIKEGQYRMSVRYRGNALKILTESLKGLNGSGGGHKNACGFSIAQEEFSEFLSRVESKLK